MRIAGNLKNERAARAAKTTTRKTPAKKKA
jgi:hypothetical protein